MKGVWEAGIVSDSSKAFALASLPWLILAIAMLFGWKAYSMNYQAFYMWGHFTPVSAFLADHQHAMRYLVYWPIFKVAQLVGFPPNGVFTAVAWLLLATVALTVIKSSELIDAERSPTKILVYSVVAFALAIAMDGRLAVALAGYSIAIWLVMEFVTKERWHPAYAPALVVAGIMTSVSSGALSVFYVFVLLIFVWSFSGHRNGVWTMRASSAAVLMIFAHEFIRGAMVNVAFFGGGVDGFITMLRHGLGKVFLLVGAPGLVVLSVLALAGVLCVWWLHRRQSAPMFVLTLAVVPAALGGLFGFSTMALGVVPLMLAARQQLWREPFQVAKTTGPERSITGLS